MKFTVRRQQLPGNCWWWIVKWYHSKWSIVLMSVVSVTVRSTMDLTAPSCAAFITFFSLFPKMKKIVNCIPSCYNVLQQ